MRTLLPVNCGTGTKKGTTFGRVQGATQELTAGVYWRSACANGLRAFLARRVRPRMRWLAFRGSGRGADKSRCRSGVTGQAADREAQAAAVCGCTATVLASARWLRWWSVTLFGRVVHASLGRARGKGWAVAIAVGHSRSLFPRFTARAGQVPEARTISKPVSHRSGTSDRAAGA